MSYWFHTEDMCYFQRSIWFRRQRKSICQLHSSDKVCLWGNYTGRQSGRSQILRGRQRTCYSQDPKCWVFHTIGIYQLSQFDTFLGKCILSWFHPMSCYRHKGRSYLGRLCQVYPQDTRTPMSFHSVLCHSRTQQGRAQQGTNLLQLELGVFQDCEAVRVLSEGPGNLKDREVERGSNEVEFLKFEGQQEWEWQFGEQMLVERVGLAEWAEQAVCSMGKMGKMQNYRGWRVWSRRSECQWVP